MVNYLEVLADLLKQPHYLLVILITIYVIAGAFDFIIGSVNATITNGIEFKTKIAQLGIIRKLALMVLMILVIPLAMILPFDIGVYSLSILYIGVVVSEVYSIAGHIGLVKDGNKHKNLIGTLFTSLIDTILKSKNKGE